MNTLLMWWTSLPAVEEPIKNEGLPEPYEYNRIAFRVTYEKLTKRHWHLSGRNATNQSHQNTDLNQRLAPWQPHFLPLHSYKLHTRLPIPQGTQFKWNNFGWRCLKRRQGFCAVNNNDIYHGLPCSMHLLTFDSTVQPRSRLILTATTNYCPQKCDWYINVCQTRPHQV